MTRIQGRSLALAGAIALVSALLAVLWGYHHGSGQPQQTSMPLPLPSAGRDPGISGFCGGTVTSLSDATQAAPFRVLFPSSSAANQDDLSVVYWCPDSSQVAMSFASGVIVDEGPSTLTDPPSTWADIVKAYPGGGYSVASVRGQPALMGDPTSPVPGGQDGLEWVEGGLQVTIYGDGKTPLKELLSVADSLQPIDSAQDSA